jgi:small subunit ribosomal protein S27e
MHLASVLRSSNLSITEVNYMSANFLKISCRDCSNESTIFSRATTVISCTVCGATLTNPSGGKAQLVGCNVVESLE